jgi:hypothetical protein
MFLNYKSSRKHASRKHASRKHASRKHMLVNNRYLWLTVFLLLTIV